MATLAEKKKIKTKNVTNVKGRIINQTRRRLESEKTGTGNEFLYHFEYLTFSPQRKNKKKKTRVGKEEETRGRLQIRYKRVKLRRCQR